MKYRNPANVRGGISLRPSLIITNEVDHKKVTSSASRSAAVRDIDLLKMSASGYFQKNSFIA